MDGALAPNAVVRTEAVARIFRREAGNEARIGMEATFVAMKLTPAAKNDLRAPFDGVNSSANLDIAVEQAVEISDPLCIAVKGENEKVAIGV